VLDVDITHSSVSDLRVELVSPGGTSALIVKHQDGVSGKNLITSWDSNSHQGLASLLNQPAQGTWALRVQDLVAGGSGKFNRWGLQFYP
jgi:subtilisin-like proprotein convertase family protein